ncbi:uncharacterized methyltransferase YdaC-like [Engraulis encrasicolus]|uniref:uncharacterized methyltransferase YdaC-like n=1 Tax=Engraulis encrasicolus TaxID=184585 RepID=UPI002FD34E50
MMFYRAIAGRQLGHPTKSLGGWLASKIFIQHNRLVEESAVALCGISPGDTVLELGHGPGLGLEAAARLLTAPSGHLLGVDYSEYMHQVAGKRLSALVASGKVTLHHCDVAAMPIADSSVDKVFHCNCYYFWPDLKKGGAEIHRVMKAGGLMVTVLRLDVVEQAASQNIFTGESWRPEDYMKALEDVGFSNVRMEDRTETNITFQVIFATASK